MNRFARLSVNNGWKVYVLPSRADGFESPPANSKKRVGSWYFENDIGSSTCSPITRRDLIRLISVVELTNMTLLHVLLAFSFPWIQT